MSEIEIYNNEPLASLVPGMSIESAYYLCEVAEKMTKTGKPYCDLKLRDKTGCRVAKYWNPLEGFESCSYVYVRGNTQEYAGATNIIVNDIININKDQINVEDFVVIVDNIKEYESTFEDYINQIKNPTLKAIIGVIFTDKFKEQFFNSPASEGSRYGAIGGALMQSCRVAAASEQLAYSYDLSSISKELLIAAALISNSGKVYAYELIENIPTLTIKGALYGDFALAYQKIILALIKLKQDKKTAAELSGVLESEWSLDEDIILQLTHMVLSSRSGNIEPGNKDEKKGSILPQSIEAMILSQSFLSDERAAFAYDSIKSTEFSNNDINDPFTPWDFNTKRRFLKPDFFKKL
jgi:23S rRNA maturation-related 3'-5' exoribonuclease YhaM